MITLGRLRASALIVFILMPLPGAAQENGRWEVEVHGGGIASSTFSGGSTQLPGSAVFTASSGRTSRRVSSWFFGEGASLLSPVGAQLGVGSGMTPLDAVLTGGLADRAPGGHAGIRISRSVSPWLAVELTFDYSVAPVEIDAEAAALIDASSASFASTWSGIVDTGPFANAVVDSTRVVSTREGRQTFATGTLNFNLRSGGRVIPYLVAGGGLVSTLGDSPRATLEGRYQFDVASAWQVRESDRVVIRHETTRHGLAGVVGGGVKLMASRRWGVRLDARLYLSDTSSRTVLDANPEVATLTPAGQLSSVTSPSLQLSNNPTTGFPSSLSGPAVTEFTTFDASGIRPQLAISGGLLWRF